jgi:hypothetical protein
MALRRPELKGSEGKADSERSYRANDGVSDAFGFDLTSIVRDFSRQIFNFHSGLLLIARRYSCTFDMQVLLEA